MTLAATTSTVTLGTDHCKSVSLHPQSNGQTERMGGREGGSEEVAGKVAGKGRQGRGGREGKGWQGRGDIEGMAERGGSQGVAVKG